jgi:hypothetical protein
MTLFWKVVHAPFPNQLSNTLPEQLSEIDIFMGSIMYGGFIDIYYRPK